METPQFFGTKALNHPNSVMQESVREYEEAWRKWEENLDSPSRATSLKQRVSNSCEEIISSLGLVKSLVGEYSTSKNTASVKESADKYSTSKFNTLKAISLWQPWASLIPLGLKHYETRSWKTNYRGKLLICSTAKST